MPNGAKIFWQQCHHSTVTAINLCLRFVVEGTLVLVMLLCKIQMVLSTSTDQSDPVSRYLLYLFVSCLRLEFILCNLSIVSHSRFRGNLKECLMNTVSNEGGFPPFASTEMSCCGPAKAGFAALLSLYARLWPDLWEASFCCGDHNSITPSSYPVQPT